jgi:hypothetical protein
MTRRWQPCEFTLDGIDFRVVQGAKLDDHGQPGNDLKLEWRTPIGWVPIRFFTVGVIFDFLAFNEDQLYRPEWGRMGGRKLLDYLRWTYKHDIDKAEAGLRAEKAGSRRPRSLFDMDEAVGQ